MPKVIALINYHDGLRFRSKGEEYEFPADQDLEGEIVLKRVKLKGQKTASTARSQTLNTRELDAKTDPNKQAAPAASPAAGSQEYGTRDLQSSQSAARKASTAAKPAAASTTINIPTKPPTTPPAVQKPSAAIAKPPTAPPAATPAKAGKGNEGGGSGQ